jgi:short-subunit dehydrogenase involved in D-alanine esterification of teichoic acids
MEITGQAAIVTGGASGLGAATAPDEPFRLRVIHNNRRCSLRRRH